MQRRQFVGSGLALAATWPLRGFTSVLTNQFVSIFTSQAA
jgi:hypothetical protein